MKRQAENAGRVRVELVTTRRPAGRGNDDSPREKSRGASSPPVPITGRAAPARERTYR